MKLPLIILIYMISTVAAQNPGCGQSSYFGPSGVITSPNYPGNYGNYDSCSYYIYNGSTTAFLSITFQAFDVEYCADGCDFVEVSCDSDRNFPPQVYSGTSLPGDILIFGCSVGKVWLYADGAVVRSGFHLTYNITEDVATTCGATSHGGSYGVISSPNYPGNYYDDHSCDYYIYASNGSSFTLTFKTFDVEDGYDFVTVSCATNSSFPPQSYSGRSLPDAISIPWCSKGLVSFRTDSSTVSSGFSIDYYVSNGGCGNTAYTGPSGYVTSANYPNFYPHNQNCYHVIWSPERTTFYLEFETFFLYYSCSSDWLEIRCIDNSDHGPYTFCGPYTSFKGMYFYECSQVLLVFHSAEWVSEQGFKILYNVYPDSETTTAGGTPGYTQTTPASTLEPACKYENLYGPSGVITSPNYPGNYYNTLSCTYYIYIGRGSSISIFFKDFDVQDTLDYLMIECQSDSSIPAQQHTGQTLPAPLSMMCTTTSLYFYTNSELVSSGFSIDYYVSEGGHCGSTVYNGSSGNGNVMSPLYPSDYNYYENCSNIIWVPQRSHFHLNFLFFELQDCGVCPSDWVEVSCLDNNPSEKHRFCGTSTYPIDFYQCSQVLVLFHTDGSDNYKGFNLEYIVNAESETTTVPGTTNLPQTTQTPPVPTPEPGCDEFHCGPSGTITSPNYPGNYDGSLRCNHYIQSSTGSHITLVFQHFDLEDDKDYIIISCPANPSFPEQRFSGHTLPTPLTIPLCSQASVYFHTDTDTVYSGFRIDYFVSDAGCGNTVYTSSNGSITSPNYPGLYRSNLNCSNIIMAPQRSHFHLQFWSLYMDDCEQCLCDFVELSCLDNNPAHRFRNCLGTGRSFDFYQCSQVLVWFHSDWNHNWEGFRLDYNIYPDQGCGEASYFGPSGVISSPGYDAGSYLDSLYCDYDIYASSSSASIAIIYRAFSTEECCDYVTISCPTNSTYPSATYSGSSLPQSISIPWCSQVRLNLDSDSSVTSTGFSLEYHISLGGCGDTLYTGSQGYVSSPNYPNSYGVSQNCSNIILASKPTSFDVSFLHMELEECCDFVELSCLDNPEYGNNRFTGDSIPPPQYIPQCTQILVWFYTDDSNEYSGFNLEYSINPGLANKERHNGGEKFPSDGKPTSGKKVLNKEKHNGGEKVPGDGKPKAARK